MTQRAPSYVVSARLAEVQCAEPGPPHQPLVLQHCPVGQRVPREGPHCASVEVGSTGAGCAPAGPSYVVSPRLAEVQCAEPGPPHQPLVLQHCVAGQRVPRAGPHCASDDVGSVTGGGGGGGGGAGSEMSEALYTAFVHAPPHCGPVD